MLLALIALLLHPSTAPIIAMDDQSSLRVIVSDVSGNGLAGLDISVRAADDATLLAQSSTDSSGQVLFAALPVRPVRVRVSGQLSNTRVLSQHGSDAEGVWLALGPGDNALAFVVLADGRVELNPEGLIEADLSPLGQEIASPTDMLTGEADGLKPADCGAVGWGCGAAPENTRGVAQAQEQASAWGAGRPADTIRAESGAVAAQRAVLASMLSVLIVILALLLRGRRA